MKDLDRTILSLVNERWQKVAMIIARASGSTNDDVVSDHIRAPVEDGKLEARGDFRMAP